MTDEGRSASRINASKSAPQDDARERELIDLFELEKPPGAGRSATDALLYLDGKTIPFELKSTSTSSGSVTTVRDFGPGHIERWKGKHWLIGVYEGNPLRLKHTIYASPDAMNPWISDKAEYVRMDFELAILVPTLVGRKQMEALLSRKALYSLTDAKKVQKSQYSAAQYKEKMDREGGYSPERMLDLLRERVAYLMRRGSTLNNPHVPSRHFAAMAKITENHGEVLRALVREVIAPSVSTIELATR